MKKEGEADYESTEVSKENLSASSTGGMFKSMKSIDDRVNQVRFPTDLL